MTQKIDPIKLKAAAEHLEWACQQYPDEEAVQSLYQGLQPMIEDAKTGRVLEPITDRNDIPYRWAVSAEGLYRAYVDPDIEGAYVAFAIQMEGGLTEQDKRIHARIKAIQDAILKGDES
ncbi:MAG: hypothetical protein R3E42_16390 [Burkholderiaceae bacterium]